MKAIIKGKWFVLLVWAAILSILITLAPNMESLVRDKGQIKVPDGYSSTLAGKILKDVQSKENKGKDVQTALVFHSNKKLTDDDLSAAEKAVNKLESQQKKLGITSITSHFKEKQLKDELVSKDGKTILVSLKISAEGREAKEISSELYQSIKDCKLEHYYTGSWMIDEDLVNNSQDGLKKTEGITVVFILVILLLVFRSVIAPLIPLVTVGISYLASQSIVAMLVDKANFPLSNFTQTFLVSVLFGIGTDYCILLLSRFKEEMNHHETVGDAIIETYRTAGKTVFFSGLAVMIGFASIGFSTFKLYQSASAVAVGVAILLLALFTVVPFFMSVLGRMLFWPAKGKLEHRDSKLWGIVGGFALARPLIALIMVAVISVPFLFTYDGKLSYNSLEEIGDNFNSIKGFNIVSDSFGPGESMPTQVVIKNDEKMNSSEYIALAEQISQELKKVDNVSVVRSVTRPTGEPINDLYISKQAQTLGSGLGKGNDGIKQISSGLKQAGSQMEASAPKLKEATNGIGSLINGTKQLKDGMVPLKTGLEQIQTGLKKGSAGSSQIKKGLKDIKTNSEVILNGSKQLLAGYQQAAAGIGTLQQKYQGIETGVAGLQAGLGSLNTNFANLENKYDVENDQDYNKIKGTVLFVQGKLAELDGGIKQLNGGLTGIQSGLITANTNFETLISGQQQLIAGMEALINGISQQQAGLDAMANGQGQIIGNLSKFTGGLNGIQNGQQQLLNGFGSLSGQLDQLTDGFTQSANGLNEVSNGLNSAQDYLDGVSQVKRNGFYIPDEVLSSKDFAQAMNAYISKDGKVMTMDVVFNINPYSNKAISRVDDIKQAVERGVKDTKLENAKIAVGGVTSIYSDLNTISDHDYSRTVVLMLAGIAIILVILLRSFIMPLYLIASLILTYYTSMAISEAIFVNWLGYTGISWAVPFFAFVILIALGIDYSIFLMDRFNEHRDMPVKTAILFSMRKMGTVIISAAVILGGTFAAMMPAGVLSLLQIATILLVGLSLYSLVILPLFVPVMVKIFGEANWWPFMKNDKVIFDRDNKTIQS